MNETALRLLREGAFLPAMPLVLDENRHFDEAGQRRLIRYYLAAGADGIAAAVHTTQFAIREIGLFDVVLRVAAEEIDAYHARTGRTVLKIAGVCGKTEQAVSEARTAKRFGYDAVLVSPGGLAEMDEAYLIERTRRISEVLDTIGFYLQPAVGGRVFSYRYWEAICGIEGVKALKCAAFSRYLTVDVARAIAFASHKVALYTGNDDSIVTDLLTEYRFEGEDGCRSVRTVGGLLGHWAVWTHTAVELFHRLKQEVLTGRIASEWLTTAARITDANAAFFDTAHRFSGCIAGIHEVLRRQGLMKGIWCIDPEEGLSEGQSEEIDRVYRMYPSLNDDAFVKEFLNADKNNE